MLYEEMGQESNSNKKEGDDDCLDDNDVISSPMDWDNEDAASLAEDYAVRFDTFLQSFIFMHASFRTKNMKLLFKPNSNPMMMMM